MNILTIYTKSAEKALTVIDDLARTTNGTIKVLACDPARLYNDANHDDVSMAAVTFYMEEDWLTIKEFINDDNVFVCEEDPSDW
jgi:hypothetical protein